LGGFQRKKVTTEAKKEPTNLLKKGKRKRTERKKDEGERRGKVQGSVRLQSVFVAGVERRGKKNKKWKL